jgi:iron complex transport system substrate-binding protein
LPTLCSYHLGLHSCVNPFSVPFPNPGHVARVNFCPRAMPTVDDSSPIVSLLPSATEILHFVGAGSRIVGCTHECDYPVGAADDIKHVTRSLLPPGLKAAEIDAAVAKAMKSDAHTIYALDTHALHALHPRYIVTQKLCDVCAVPERHVRALACSLPSDCTVVSADPSTLQELFDSILTVGDAVGAPKTAQMVQGLKQRLESVKERTLGHASLRVAVLEWPDPPYAP